MSRERTTPKFGLFGFGKPVILSAITLVALLLPAAASAKDEGQKITVMSRNLFLGADLGPASARRALGRRSTARA